jgi:Zn-dependent protease with chaperone function
MWSILKAILTKLAVLRGLIAVLGSLAALLPIAIALIKLIGVPLLVVMLVLGLPLLLVLALFGFPFIAVLTIAGVVMSVVFAVIKVGIIALKLFLFVVLPLWLAWKVASWAFRRRDDGERRAPDTPESAEAAP